MAPKPMQDIVPKGSRSIRRVPLPPKKEVLKKEVIKEITKPRPVERVEIEEIEVVTETPEAIETDTLRSVRSEFESARKHTHRKKFSFSWNKKAVVITAIAVVFIGGVVTVSNAFHGATVTLTPRHVTQNIESELTAKKNPGAGELGFSIVTVKQIGSETVRANGEKQVNTKATGTIVIYNNYNASPQRLIKNTRFSTPEGMIFRIVDSVTVPGKKGTLPGSVEATVIADEAGESYNVGLKDFTIPGFKGDPRYTTFYARSKTPIAGGFSGIQKIVSDTDRAKAKANIESKVKAELIKQISINLAPNTAYIPNAYTIEFKSLPEESKEANEVTLRQEGTLSIVTFDQKALGTTLAQKELSKYDGLPVIITNLETLSFKPKGDFKPTTTETITFTVSGRAAFEWYYDELTFKQGLLGKTRAQIPVLLQKYPTIEKADISLRPIWARSLPDSLDKVVIKKAI